MSIIYGLILFSLIIISGIDSCKIIKQSLQDSTCIKEGESVSVIPEMKTCCNGLTAISQDRIAPQTTECVYGYMGGVLCTKCGDGICKDPENKCNCPQDCSGAICGNGICEEGECTSEKYLTCSSDNQIYCTCKECDKDCRT